MRRRLPRRLPRSLRRAAAPAASVAMGSAGYGAGGPVWLDDFRSKRPPTPVELVNAYKAVAYACIRLNAQGVARVPLRLYATRRLGQRPAGRGLVRIGRAVPRRRDLYLRGLRGVSVHIGGAEDIEEIVEHPYVEGMHCPCPFFDGPQFLVYLATCLDAIGSAYFVPVRPGPTWASSEWWPLQAQYVLPVKGAGDRILDHYAFFGQRLEPDDVVRLRNISLRDPYLSAYSPLHACFEQLGLVNHYTAVLEGILKTGGRPSGVMTPADPAMPVGEPERQRVEREVNSGRFSGPRSGYIAVTSGAYKWTPFDYPPIDLGGLELTKNQRLTAANCFDVPISLLQTEDSNRAVAEAGNYQHQRNAVEPRCVTIAGGLTAMARQVDPRLFFAFDNPVEADEERRAKIFDMGLKNGTATVNEVRAEQGLPPVEGGDEPLVSKGLVRLRDTAADPEPEPEPPPATAPTTEPGGDEPPSPDDRDDEQADTERAILDRLTRFLDRLDETHDARAGRRDAGGAAADAAEADPGGRTAAGEEGPAEHVWAADGGAAAGEAGGVLPQAGEAGPGDAADGRDGAAGAPADPDGLGRPDGGGDDADPVGLLGRGGEGPEGAAGPGPGRVAGDGPAHAGDDPPVGDGVLPEHERDDQLGAGDGPAEAP